MDPYDPDSHNILSEESILTLLKYYRELKKVYTEFFQTNFNEKAIVRPWKVIQQENQPMMVRCFLKFCRIFHLTTHLFNIQALNEFLYSVIPPRTKEEIKFFEESTLIKEYERDITYETSKVDVTFKEPTLYFHEFLFMLAKIALKSVFTTQNSISSKLECFFKEKISVKRSESPHILGYHSSEEEYNIDEDSDLDFESDADYEDGYQSDSQVQMMKRAQQAFRIEEELNYEDILRELKTLPQIYDEPEISQVNPPPYAMARVQFNVPKKPLTEEEKKALKAKKAKPKPKPQRKKDEPPPKPILWAPKPEPGPPSSFQVLRDMKKSQSQAVFPTQSRALNSNPAVAPCIIKQVLFPPPAPPQISTLIESALVYQNDANYELSLSTFVEARQQWRVNLNLKELRPQIELFFELSIASVYQSWGKDGHALAQYMRAHNIKLLYNHPDKAFPYCGLGGVFYHMQEIELSLRCFIKARQIREERLGGDTVDTATVYNNIGCCMQLLERNIQAYTYYELAQAILECELGPNHERYLTVSRNIMKVKRLVQGRQPEFKPLFHFGVPYNVVKGKKKKKKGKGKKKKK